MSSLRIAFGRRWIGALALAAVAACAAGVIAFLLRAGPPAESDGPWGADYFPNVPLVTQDGKKVRFYDDLIKGKVVAVNFIFTGCSASCSMETARLREVQEILGERMGSDVFFYSITIDPDNDTPQELARYAKKFNVGPGWVFLTGKNEDITLLRDKLGLYMPAIQQGVKDHNLSLIIGNQSTGRWMKSSPFENPHILATQLGSWLHNWKLPGDQETNYANAPTQMRQMSSGQALFRTRCASCHVVADRGNALTAQTSIGPDLTGVTARRDRAWLARWIKEPDRMLAEKDPLAMAMYAEYNELAMPNLRLTDAEVTELLAYLDEVGRPDERQPTPVALQE